MNRPSAPGPDSPPAAPWRREGGPLSESEARYRLIVASALDCAIIATDREGRIESWSPGAEAVFGWSVTEALGADIAMTFSPEDRARGVPEEERRLARGRGIAPDVRWHLRKDGRRVFVEGTARPRHDDAGALRGFFKIGRDLTAQRLAGMRERAAQRRAAVAGSATSVITIVTLSPVRMVPITAFTGCTP